MKRLGRLEVKLSLGQIAARERRLSGLTQEEVAELIPCDVSTVRRWEVGIRRLTIEMAAAYGDGGICGVMRCGVCGVCRSAGEGADTKRKSPRGLKKTDGGIIPC